MPENKFEKQAQKRMEELSLNPSPKVWEAVERRIRNKRKKRRFVFWLFFFFILSGSGIVIGLLSTQNENDKAVQSNITVEKNKMPLSSNQNQAEPKGQFVIDSIGNEKTVTNNTKQKTISDNLITADGSINGSGEISGKSYKRNSEEKYREKNIVQHRELQSNSAATDDSSITANYNNSDKLVTTGEESSIKTETKPIVESANSKDLKPIEKLTKEPETTDSSTSKSQQSNNKSRKWLWGIMAEAGLSQTGNGINFFNSSIVANAQYATQPPVGNKPSLIHPSGAFTGGFFVQRSLSKRLNLDLAMSYSFLSTKTRVGSKLDSLSTNGLSTLPAASGSFYQGSNARNSYTNHYRLLNVSAALSWKIFKKIPLYWNNGLVYSRLVFSDALFFDYNLPVYYRNFSLFNKNHFFIGTGLSFPVHKQLSVDAFMKYDLVPISNNSNLSPTHFNYYGVGVKYFLRNKK